jgi:hypothetical protein
MCHLTLKLICDKLEGSEKHLILASLRLARFAGSGQFWYNGLDEFVSVISSSALHKPIAIGLDTVP